MKPQFKNNQLNFDFERLERNNPYSYTDITTDYDSDLGFILDILDDSYFYAKEEDRDFDDKLVMDNINLLY